MRPPTVTVAVFCLLLGLLALLFFVLPDSPFSVTEKRSLRTAPSFRLSELYSGRLTAAVNDWYADQFPFRQSLVRLKSVAEYALGKGGNNGILVGTGGQLARVGFDLRVGSCAVSGTDRIPSDLLRANANGVNRAAANARVPTVFLFPGRTLEIARERLPYPDGVTEQARTDWRESLSPDVCAPDVCTTLREHSEAGEQVMYRTDHHWTTRGAYYAYRETMTAFGMEAEILPEAAFRRVTVTDSFRGTFLCAGAFPWVRPDAIEVWYGEDDGDYEILADGAVRDGFYTLPSGDGMPTGYELFLDGTHDIVTVRKKGAGESSRPLLLIFKDSFANSLAPFLARHFDLVLLNLSSTRSDFTDLTAISGQYGADRVLVVWNDANLFYTDVASRFR